MSSTFVLLCPKCLSTGLERFKDRAASYGDRSDLSLKCRTCGKLLLGTAVVEAEWKKQKKEWDKHAPERAVVDAEAAGAAEVRRRRDRATAAAHRKHKENERLAAEQARQVKDAANRQWAEGHRAEMGRQRQAVLAPNLPICAWQDCNDPIREGSRYCSRSCSNKNARWRHKQRKLAS